MPEYEQPDYEQHKIPIIQGINDLPEPPTETEGSNISHMHEQFNNLVDSIITGHDRLIDSIRYTYDYAYSAYERSKQNSVTITNNREYHDTAISNIQTDVFRLFDRVANLENTLLPDAIFVLENIVLSPDGSGNYKYDITIPKTGNLVEILVNDTWDSQDIFFKINGSPLAVGYANSSHEDYIYAYYLKLENQNVIESQTLTLTSTNNDTAINKVRLKSPNMHRIKALQDTVLKRKTLDSTRLLPSEKNNFQKDKIINCEVIRDGGNNHWAIKSHKQSNWWYAYKLHCDVDWDNLITYYHFEKCFRYARKSDIDTFFQPFNNALAEYEINTVIRIAAFIAQICHESGSLRYKEELASGAAYEGRRDLGNIYRGDGRRYKGRGLIQLTGRHNYGKFGKLLGIDLVNNPTLAIEPNTSCRIAALYWSNRNLNKYADWNSERGFRIITRKINGGYNGLDDRLNHWRHAKKILHC